MIIHKIKITNFKSIYGTQIFDFDNLQGLIKLSGPIGSGKTTISEAILYGLYGNVKGQNIGQLVAWNMNFCEIELDITSKNKKIHIVRNNREPLIVYINDKLLTASSKRNTQEILEEELYDVPKLAVTKMCVISFNAFNSLAAMSPYETKQFLDEIFGFKLFSDYNEEVIVERKNELNEQIKLQSIYDENVNQIENLKKKQIEQTSQIKDSFNIEAATLGKQAKNHYNTFKTGICPTCGQKIDQAHIDEYKNKMEEYAALWKQHEAEKKKIEAEKQQVHESYHDPMIACDTEMDSLRQQISKLDAQFKSYNDSIQLIQDNYDDLIKEYEEKTNQIKEKLDKCEREILEWSEMSELFTKTLRYKLLESLIPHINKSIQYFINRLEQSYKVEYDQEFKAHIFVDSFDKEISYNNLSTGQRKSLDLAIIFGILQNVISSIEMNVFVLDELFSNMDSDTRNIMLSLLNETMSDDKSIFVINHAEMQDDYFKHKIRVRLENQKVDIKKKKETNTIYIKKSKYEQVF